MISVNEAITLGAPVWSRSGRPGLLSQAVYPSGVGPVVSTGRTHALPDGRVIRGFARTTTGGDSARLRVPVWPGGPQWA